MQTKALPPGPAEGFDLGGSDESLARLREYFARFGDVYRVFAPGRGVYNYVINHPDDIKHVLLANHRNYTKGEGMDRVKILLGNGIMTSEGDFWRRQRRMMQPCFHRRIIDRFGGLIHAVNDEGVSRYDWTLAILEEAVRAGWIPQAPPVEKVTTAFFNSTMRRPTYTVMNNEKLTKLLGHRPGSWRPGLRKMLAQMK